MTCESELHREYKTAVYDARGIFLTYSCPMCHDSVVEKYRPEVLTDANYWAPEPIDEEDY